MADAEINHSKDVQHLLKTHNLDGMLFYSPENRYWYTDFMSTLGYLLVTKTKAQLFVDGRYITAAQSQAKNVTIEPLSQDLKTMVTTIKKQGLKTIGVEAEYLSVAMLEALQEKLKPIVLQPIRVDRLRMIKTPTEVNRIRQAAKIADQAFADVLAKIKPGMTEAAVEQIIWNSFKANGAEKPSFDTIVGSGQRSAMPHAKASSKVIQPGDFVVIDFGALYQGYCSDMTRTVAISWADPKLAQIYKIVAAAQAKAIGAIKPGVKAGAIDQIARDYIQEQGYGAYFGHGFGHGMGIEIHEEPYERPNSEDLLQPGMVVSAEPGIYLPGIGGVRIEDDVLVTPTGHEVLTTAPKDQLIIIAAQTKTPS